MTVLAGLKLTALQKPTHVTPIQVRRNKLAKRIWEQMELAKAQQAGTTFAPTKFRSVTDAETGLRKQVETHKRVKAWWFTADNGKLAPKAAQRPWRASQEGSGNQRSQTECLEFASNWQK
jgi:hypothetical protein